MANKEEKEKEVRRLKAQAAIAELEFKIMEREDEIKRIREHIEKQREIIKNN